MKRLVLLTVILLLAVPVFAQGPQFTTGSANPTLRSEGLTETVGNVSMVTSAGGTIPAGSSISVTYTSTITNAAFILFPNVTVTAGPCTAAATPAACPDTVAASGSIITLGFTSSRVLAPGAVIIVFGIRVNATAVGKGVSVNANLATNPATAASFTNAGPLPVGSVFNGLSTVVKLTPTIAQLVCGPVATTPAPGNAFTVEVKEAFGSAITSNTDEIALSNTPPPDNGTRFRVDFTPSTLPTGVAIVLGALPAGLVVQGTPTAVSWTFQPTTGVATNTGAIDTYTIPFTITWSSALATGSAGAVTATVKFVPLTTSTSTTIVRFATDVTQGTGTVVTLNDCVTTMYFPFIAADVAGFDTSVAISNSSKDTDETGAAIFGTTGAVAQAGTCKWVGYKTPDLSVPGTITATPVTFTTPSIAAGGTWAGSLGSTAAFGGDPAVTGDGVAGYAFVTCNFLNAHGFAFITNGFGGAVTISHGYLALIVPRGATRVVAGGENLNN